MTIRDISPPDLNRSQPTSEQDDETAVNICRSRIMMTSIAVGETGDRTTPFVDVMDFTTSSTSSPSSCSSDTDEILVTSSIFSNNQVSSGIMLSDISKSDHQGIGDIHPSVFTEQLSEVLNIALGDDQEADASSTTNAPQTKLANVSTSMLSTDVSPLRDVSDSASHVLKTPHPNPTETDGIFKHQPHIATLSDSNPFDVKNEKRPMSDDDDFVVPPPLLSRVDPVQRGLTPGAFRSGVGSSMSLSSRFCQGEGSTDRQDIDSFISNSGSHGDHEHTEQPQRTVSSSALPSSADSTLLAPSLLSQDRQWSFRTLPLEARLVTSSMGNRDEWNDSEVPPPPGLPVATVSSCEIVVAEVVEFSQKDMQITSTDRKCSRTSLFLIVAFLIVTVIVVGVTTDKEFRERRQRVREHSQGGIPVYSHHAVVYGAKAICPQVLRLSCGGRNITEVGDDRSEIEILSFNNTNCQKIGGNSAMCSLETNRTSSPHQLNHGGVWFRCTRREYIDERKIVSAAVVYNINNSSCATKARTKSSGSLDDDIEPDDSPENQEGSSLSPNYTNNVLFRKVVTRYVGLGHFCQVQLPGAESSWTLRRNDVVKKGVVKLDECETPNATFTDSSDKKFSFCSWPANISCLGQPACMSSMVELKATDSYSICQDTNAMTDLKRKQITTALNDAISEGWSLFS
jgi:hypothetical protein